MGFGGLTQEEWDGQQYKTVTEQQPVIRRGVLLTLRDGSRIQIDDMSASRVKHLRRTKGSIKIVSGNTVKELKGSEIKGIESLPSRD